MKKLFNLNKKGAVFNIVSQGILTIPRVFFILFVVFLIMLPTGCFSQSQEQALRNIKLKEVDLALNELKVCIEKEGLLKEKLDSCFTKKNMGVKISTDKDTFHINEEKYDEIFCKIDSDKRISSGYVCPVKNELIKINDEFQNIEIKMVVNFE